MERREFIAAGVGLAVAAGAELTIGSEVVTRHTFNVFVVEEKEKSPYIEPNNVYRKVGTVEAKDFMEAVDRAFETYDGELLRIGGTVPPFQHIFVETYRITHDMANSKERSLMTALMKELSTPKS